MKRSRIKECFRNSEVFIKGKTYTKTSGYISKLFDDYSVEIAIEGKICEPADSVYVYLYSSKFARVMEKLFNDQKGNYDKGSAANSYLPRKLRNDKYGCLAMGMPGVEEVENDFILFNGGVEVSFKYFSDAVKELNSAVDVYEFLYQSDTGQLIAAIEEAWALCYICAERGLDQKQTKQLLSVDHNQPFSAKSKAFDEGALSKFFQAYKVVKDDYGHT